MKHKAEEYGHATPIARRVLLIGTLPPPVGGITIHLKRLLANLNDANIPYGFLDLKLNGLIGSLEMIWKYPVIHINISNAYVRFCLILLGRLLDKTVIFTLHGKLGALGKARYYIDLCSIFLSNIPLMLNKVSFDRAILLNRRTMLISAFIPPIDEEPLEEKVQKKLDDFSKAYSQVWLTGAAHLAYDKDGAEIYQVSTLVSIFNRTPSKALVIADPSGQYLNYFINRGIEINPNIFLISYPQSFFELLKKSTGLLRITTTDGDSLSIHEAMSLNKPVIATDVVNRPYGVTLVSLDEYQVESALDQHYLEQEVGEWRSFNAAETLIKIYSEN